MLTKTACSCKGKSYGSLRGFTLVEILIVLVVVGVAIALVVPRFIQKADPAKIDAARLDVSAISNALQTYKLDNNMFPTVDQGLGALTKKPTRAPIPPAWKDVGYLEKLPVDPWGRPYLYKNPGEHGDIDVYTLGADGQPGGTGADADIGSWM
ncbi:MAG TPA: type II secretion system major pseudopilin GspG [Rhodocyclaceae bacterium]|nr:type II secretion system major pseudopilin GspG [Rhodocyclaceae bacterium]